MPDHENKPYARHDAHHRADQYGAAYHHTTAVRERIHNALPGPARPTRTTPALAGMIRRWVAAAVTECRACPHVRPGSPRPLLAAAWLPGQMACGPCAVTMLAVDPAAEHICDGCGRDYPGRLQLGTVRLGLVILHYGACDRCLTGPASSTRPRNRRARRAGGAR